MLNQQKLDEMASKLHEIFENSPAKDIEKNTRALLTQGFSRLDLVTREEFEVQARLLEKSQERIQQLENRIAQLENRPAVSGNQPETQQPQ